MAEFGAHLTSTHGAEVDPPPSLFEVLAQENLMKSVQPAVRYVAQVLAARNPARYGRLLRHSEELYALLALLLEHHHLNTCSASFAENFYGMKRVPLLATRAKSGNSSDETMTTSHRVRSLLCLVLIPYLRTKCEGFYQRQREAEQRGTQVSGALCRAVLALYPAVHTLWEAAVLYCQLTYVLRRGAVHSPLLPLAGVQLKTLSEEDIIFQQSSLQYPANPNSLCARALWTAQRCLGVAAVSLSSGLSVTMFFLQFLEWWYASDTSVSSLTALPVPPPPRKLQCEGLPSISTICPVCLRTRTNDTALMSSGLVFCYPCVYPYVSQHGSCPVTGAPTTTLQLVKLYQSTQ